MFRGRAEELKLFLNIHMIYYDISYTFKLRRPGKSLRVIQKHAFHQEVHRSATCRKSCITARL